MAENETLDLWHKNSGRWRYLHNKYQIRCSVSAIAEETLSCLSRSLKKISKNIPITDLLDCVSDGKDVHGIIRNCHFSRDYAELFEIASNKGLRDKTQIMALVLRTICSKFSDQIKHDLVPTIYKTAEAFDNTNQSVKAMIFNRINQMAEGIANNSKNFTRLKVFHDNKANLSSMSLLPVAHRYSVQTVRI
jgi:hypothetical protein